MTLVLRAIFAAILFLIPFFKPNLFFWTSLFCIFPLLSIINSYHKKGVSRADFLSAGTVFSLLVINIHLLWFWKLLYSTGSSYKYLFGIITSAYYSSILFVPFLLSSFLRGSQKQLVVAFSLFFCFSIYFIAEKSFIIFGCNEGYSLFNPFIPFASLLPEEKEYDENILILCPHGLKEGGRIRAHQIATCLARELVNRRGHCLALLPESTFPYNLEEYKEFLPAWCDCHDNIDIIIGSHKQEGGKIFNCVYHIHNGEIKQVYKKKHLMPFFECIPATLSKFGLGTVFVEKDKAFSRPGINDNNSDIFLIDGKRHQVFICSELYQQAKPVAQDATVLFVANSSWFMMNYAKSLALLHARLFSFLNNVEMLSSVKS